MDLSRKSRLDAFTFVTWNNSRVHNGKHVGHNLATDVTSTAVTLTFY